MSQLERSEDQVKAVKKAIDWYSGDENSSRFLLTGSAGTGKTTLTLGLVEELGLDPRTEVAFVCPTGVAARRLRDVMSEQGVATTVSTIHSAIYMSSKENKKAIEGLYLTLDDLKARGLDGGCEAREIHARIEELGRPEWHLKPRDSAFGEQLTRLKLIVCDEASMVTDDIARDILGFGVPVLALGDPHQLPPVDPQAEDQSARPRFSDRHIQPVAELTIDHRAGENQLLIDFTRAVRDTGTAPAWNGEGGKLPYRPGIEEIINDFDMVIVGRNRTRWTIVNAIRVHKRLPLKEPVVGDRVICLANDSRNGAVNGQIVEITKVHRSLWATTSLGIDWVDGCTGETGSWTVFSCGFEGEAGEKRARACARGSDLVAVTFADAITCHKAQGSQWDRVLVKDEGHVFRANMGEWRYTAMTRAKSVCAVV